MTQQEKDEEFADNILMLAELWFAFVVFLFIAFAIGSVFW